MSITHTSNLFCISYIPIVSNQSSYSPTYIADKIYVSYFRSAVDQPSMDPDPILCESWYLNELVAQIIMRKFDLFKAFVYIDAVVSNLKCLFVVKKNCFLSHVRNVF